MTALERNQSGFNGPNDELDVAAVNRTPDTVNLGLVTHEPLGSMFKTVRMPPPIFNAPNLGTKASLAAKTNDPSTRHSRKLEATGLLLKLAELVIRREQDIAVGTDPDVRQGFEEVYKFLLHHEHLRMLRQQS